MNTGEMGKEYSAYCGGGGMNRILSISIWLDVKSSKGIICNFILRIYALCKSRTRMCYSETGFILSYNFWSNNWKEADIFSQTSLQ